MPKQRLNISPMLAEWGEMVDFFTFGPVTFVEGIAVPSATITTQQALVYVTPAEGTKVSFDTEGTSLFNAKVFYSKTKFYLPGENDDVQETRMRYEGKLYRLIAEKKYHSKYYVYFCEWLRVDPDALPE